MCDNFGTEPLFPYYFDNTRILFELGNYMNVIFSGLCSATVTSTCFGVGVPAVEGTLAQYRATITDFIEISTKVKDNIGGMETSVNDAVAVLEHELSILHEWEEISDNLSTKMERYPIKYLQKFKSIRKIFVRNVHDLEEVAQKFLDQPVSFFADDQ